MNLNIRMVMNLKFSFVINHEFIRGHVVHKANYIHNT